VNISGLLVAVAEHHPYMVEQTELVVQVVVALAEHLLELLAHTPLVVVEAVDQDLHHHLEKADLVVQEL
jgi:hypothetical protein